MEKEKSRIKQTSKNIVFGFLYKIVMLVLVFVKRKFFIKYIGIEFLGMNSLFSNILSFLCLADLGMGVAMNFSLYEPLKNNDERKICALVNFYKHIYNYICLFVFVIGISLIPFLKFIINLEFGIDGVYLYYVLFIIQTCASYILVYKTTVLVADQKNYVNNAVTMMVSVIKVVIQIFIVVFLKNYYIYILTDIISILITNIILNYYTKKEYPFLNQNYILEKKEKANVLNNIKSIFLYKVSSVLINSTDNIIISYIVGTVTLGYYSNYYTIIDQLSPFLTIIFTSLTASIGNLLVSSTKEKKFEIFKISTVVSNYLGIILSIGYLTLVQDFVSLWLGKDYLLDFSLVVVMSLNLLYSCLNQPVWTYREASGLYIKTKYIMLITAILNIVLSIILGKYFGITGIISATFISKMLLCFWYEPRILFKDYFNSGVSIFFKNCLKQLFIYTVCFVIIQKVLNLIICDSWLTWIFKGIIMIIISTCIYICFNIKNKVVIIMIKYKLNRYLYR